MSRMLGTLFTLTLVLTSASLAQGGGMGGGMGMRQLPPDHWVTADSLAKAVGGDSALAKKVAPHLAEVDKILKSAAEERQKMFAGMQAGGGPPDPAARQAMMAKTQEFQTQVDNHLKMVRDLLDAKQQAAFDALQKPMLRRGMGGGRTGR
ncbi:MAG: hypothetical protein HY560_04405 [Gemmatimonadetes bacterium]|nr:hypothetical protein [Gemmatimonadota bacterium]